MNDKHEQNSSKGQRPAKNFTFLLYLIDWLYAVTMPLAPIAILITLCNWSVTDTKNKLYALGIVIVWIIVALIKHRYPEQFRKLYPNDEK